ncbi:LysR family transcriptional regulator [Litorilituus lipolyticus]|uniref:LysR family transcriptional regulator n=1 Tax=Litorilituus lipolyticus TaxID=2491017 RepID=A0A502KUS2_9GAMM|nr:LysR family transcriptional regulator [Litorilituus lipolyticus]
MFKNINLLVTFECAARHQSYSTAAQELCMSQAAVSQQMRQLEQALNTKLFIRKAKQMLLSQQGEILFDSSKKALGIINQGICQIYQEDIAGELTVTSTQAFTSLWLMPRLQSFAKLHPNIQIRFLPSAGFEDFKQSQIDLAIRFGTQIKENTPKNLICEYFGEAFVYPICSAELAKGQNLALPNDLLSTWLVTLEKPGAYDWGTWFKSVNVTGYDQHKQWTKVNSTDTALTAVLNGHGVTLAAPYLCKPQLDSGELVIPFNFPHPATVKRYMVYDQNSTRLTRLKVFMEWLKEEM